VLDQDEVKDPVGLHCLYWDLDRDLYWDLDRDLDSNLDRDLDFLYHLAGDLDLDRLRRRRTGCDNQRAHNDGRY